MRQHLLSGKRFLLFALIGVLLVSSAKGFGQTKLTIVNMNNPGEGFNDPTPRTPEGGNTGTTLGQQRLIAFQYAAGIWGATLASNVAIFVQASFEPLPCTPTVGTLGRAGATQIVANFSGVRPFPGAEFRDTWYPIALANKRAGQALNVTPGDIRTRFNSDVGTPGCLAGRDWYYGLDNNHGTNVNLVTVVLHELAHGLGFIQFANLSTGARPNDMTDIYGKYLLDKTLNKTWDQMTDAERMASALNARQVVWTGPHVTEAIPDVLSPGTPFLTVHSPASIAGIYAVGAARFGPALSSPGVTGDVVLADDGVGATSDACTALTPPNAALVNGKIALVDRGICTFVTKVKNAQNAGASAVLVADNVPEAPPTNLPGIDPTITIPSARITLGDGNTIKAQLEAGVHATLGVNPEVHAGADDTGKALMNAMNPLQLGSTIVHWDPIAFPNQLMEHLLNLDLIHSVEPPADLTLSLMRDIGWFPDADVDGVPDEEDDCPNSDLSATVVIDRCNSGVANTVFPNGCKISDFIATCAEGASDHDQFVSCVSHVTNDLKKAGTITGQQKGAIQSCAAKAHIP